MNKSESPNLTSNTAFEQLKTLLLSEDWQHFREIRDKVDSLAKEIRDKDQLIETLDPVIADLLDRKIHESKSEMAEALAPVMSEAIKKQIKDAKEDMVDALYPIIGSMVGKAINEAMRKMMEEINARIQHAANTRLIVFMKSKVLGIKPAEVLMSEGLFFNLKELFLIDKKSGLLVACHSQNNELGENDAHILGAMLTAIRQFVNDTFESEKKSDLLEIQHENHSIFIDSGRYTYLSAVYQGVSPLDFREMIQNLHHRIHNRYYKQLRDFNGETSEFHGVSSIMNRLFQKYEGYVPNNK